MIPVQSGWIDKVRSQFSGIVQYPGELVGRSSHGIRTFDPRGWRLAICNSCISQFLIKLLFFLVMRCCGKLAGSPSSTGKPRVNRQCPKLMQNFINRLTFRGSSFRVKPESLPLENSNCFAKRQIDTPQSVSFLCFRH